jgi:hypothetical protein
LSHVPRYILRFSFIFLRKKSCQRFPDIDLSNKPLESEYYFAWQPQPNQESHSTSNFVAQNTPTTPAYFTAPYSDPEYLQGTDLSQPVIPQGPVSESIRPRLVYERIYLLPSGLGDNQSVSSLRQPPLPFFPYQLHRKTLDFPINVPGDPSGLLPPSSFTADNGNEAFNDLLHLTAFNAADRNNPIRFDSLSGNQDSTVARLPIYNFDGLESDIHTFDHDLPLYAKAVPDDQPAIDDLLLEQLFAPSQDLTYSFFDESLAPDNGLENKPSPLLFNVPDTILSSLLGTTTGPSPVSFQAPPALQRLAPMPSSSATQTTSQPQRRRRKKEQSTKPGNNPYGMKGTKRCAQCLKHHQKVHHSSIKLKRLVYL